MNNIELEAKYGKRNLRDLVVKTEDGEVFNFIIARPSRSVINAVSSAKEDETKASNIMLKNCVVSGDIDALEQGDVYVAVMEEVAKLFTKATAEVKKF